ncbi:MAG: uroporphyrinogen-III C-methyltransferase [Nitrososphaerales archaeon]
MKAGKVYLVGAGPGNSELLTVKAMKLIRKADVIVYDRLACIEILREAKNNVELIYAGKSSYHHITQEEINRILVEKAKQGKIVVRLKGGDPILFGRGAEEALYLKRNDIQFEFVPGVSSALSVPIYAGIPITFRKMASSVAFVTGHEDELKKRRLVNFRKLAKSVDTIVVLMGMKRLKHILEELRRGGLPSSTPMAIVIDGTTKRQRIISGTIENIVEKVDAEKVKPPALIIIGRVVKLKDELDWYKPEHEKPVVAVTRPIHEAKALAERLESLGMNPIMAPTIEIERLKVKGFKTYLDNLEKGFYNYVVFSSINGVKSLFDLAKEIMPEEKLASLLKRCKVFAIGIKTAQEIRSKGIHSVFMPEEYSSKGLLQEISKHEIKDKRFLLIRSKGASPLLVKGLRDYGAIVDELNVYKAILPKKKHGIIELIHRIIDRRIDAIIFTSPSTIINLLKFAEGMGLSEELKIGINECIVIAIGPVTEKALEEQGIIASIIPKNHTVEGMIHSLIEKLKERGLYEEKIKR